MFYPELIISPGFVNVYISISQTFVPIGRYISRVLKVAFEKYGFQLAILVFENEVSMTTGLDSQVGDFSAHPKRRKASLKKTLNFFS
jgi:hypothetical protein